MALNLPATPAKKPCPAEADGSEPSDEDPEGPVGFAVLEPDQGSKRRTVEGAVQGNVLKPL